MARMRTGAQARGVSGPPSYYRPKTTKVQLRMTDRGKALLDEIGSRAHASQADVVEFLARTFGHLVKFPARVGK